MEPHHNSEQSNRGTLLGILLALFFGGAFLVFMILVTGGFFFYVVLAVLIMGIVGLLHYVVWGEALTEEVAIEKQAEEARQRQENYRAGREHPHGIRRL